MFANSLASGDAHIASTLVPGFDDPVAGAQATFRAALQGLAHPGALQGVDSACGVPDGLSPAMAALLLTLADADTPLWLPSAVGEGIRGFLRFHCACPLVNDPRHARFVAVPPGCEAPPLDACDAGEAAYPDRSTTLLIEVRALGEGETSTLSGPGIHGERALATRGLPAGFLEQWARNQRRFPLGVDVFLTQGRQLCGLPRTTRMED